MFRFGRDGVVGRKWCFKKMTMAAQRAAWGLFWYRRLEIPMTTTVRMGKSDD